LLCNPGNSRRVCPHDVPPLQHVLNSESFRAEVQLRTAAGAVNPAQLSSITLNIEGARTVAVVVTDLTHERTERGLRESNRLKDEFLATLSHELRTPLNVILGWTRMLLHDHLNDASRKHALELIDRNAQAQAQLVNRETGAKRLPERVRKATTRTKTARSTRSARSKRTSNR
jgi:signal transduction histidine kinase